MSELQPVGIERDKQIAELKGLTVIDVNQRGNRQYQYKTGPGGYGKGFPRKKVPPYSTDISCAMELWEEMKGKFPSMHLSYMPDKSCRVYLKYEDMRGPIIYEGGETEADAISGAYVKWRTA